MAGEVSPVYVTGQVDGVATGVGQNSNSVNVTGKDCYCVTRNLKTRTLLPVYYHVATCQSCSFCRRVTAKEKCKSRSSRSNKICEKCFLCRSVESCSKCHKCLTCCTKSTCRDQITKVLGKMGSTRRQPQSVNSPQRRLHPRLPVPSKLDKSTYYNKLLCRSPQEQLPVGGIASAVRQKCNRVGPKSTVPGVLQPVIFSAQTQQPVETDLRPQQTQPLSEHTVIQNGDTRDHKNLPPGRGVGDLHRFQGCILPHTYKRTVQEVPEVLYPGQNLPIQSTTLWSLKNTQGRKLMSLIGLLTATEKQVHLGRLHMRPIQWHLKKTLRWWLEESNVLTGQPLYPLKMLCRYLQMHQKKGGALT